MSCEAFCEALSAANPEHAGLLKGLLPWYDTPGTPTLTISSSYSPSNESLTITIKQRNDTAKAINKALHQPMLIPVKVGGNPSSLHWACMPCGHAGVMGCADVLTVASGCAVHVSLMLAGTPCFVVMC